MSSREHQSEHFFESELRGPSREERRRRFGTEDATKRRVIDPGRATLRDMVLSEYFPPRRIDIERIAAIAQAGTSNDNDRVSILDMGGGKGLLSKLVAESLSEKGRSAMVVDVDVDQKLLSKAAKSYRNTPGLKFVVSNSEKEAADIFRQDFNLVMVSWGLSEPLGGHEEKTSETVRKLKAPYVLAIGEVGGEFSAEFNPGDSYVKIGEWYGPTSNEIRYADLEHGYEGKYRDHVVENGQNLFEIFARKDLEGAAQKLAEKFEKLQPVKEYRWEDDLHEFYPSVANANMDPEKFFKKW